MLFKTHLVFGFLVWLIIKPYFNNNTYLLLILILFASVFPDIDISNSKIGRKIKPFSFVIEKLFGHRKLFHSLLFWCVICGLVWYLLNPTLAIIVLIGILSHLLIDSLTKQGINFLYPISTFKIAGFIETGSFMEIIFLGLLIMIVIIRIVI